MLGWAVSCVFEARTRASGQRCAVWRENLRPTPDELYPGLIYNVGILHLRWSRIAEPFVFSLMVDEFKQPDGTCTGARLSTVPAYICYRPMLVLSIIIASSVRSHSGYMTVLQVDTTYRHGQILITSSHSSPRLT